MEIATDRYGLTSYYIITVITSFPVLVNDFQSYTVIYLILFFSYIACDEGDVRLTGGATNLEGLLQICFNGSWGTVCDDFFGTPDANVVCRQLGFSPIGILYLHIINDYIFGAINDTNVWPWGGVLALPNI